MLSLEPWTIFWTVVNVLILFVALRHFLIKPVMGVIEQRNEMIRQRFDAAQKTQDEANKMKADYEQQLDTAKEQANAKKELQSQIMDIAMLAAKKIIMTGDQYDAKSGK